MSSFVKKGKPTLALATYEIEQQKPQQTLSDFANLRSGDQIDILDADWRWCQTCVGVHKLQHNVRCMDKWWLTQKKLRAQAEAKNTRANFTPHPDSDQWLWCKTCQSYHTEIGFRQYVGCNDPQWQAIYGR